VARRTSDELIAALTQQGIIPENTNRVIVDLQAGYAPIIHTEMVGDERTLDIAIAAVRAAAVVETEEREG
jgi:hypothetical protein